MPDKEWGGCDKWRGVCGFSYDEAVKREASHLDQCNDQQVERGYFPYVLVGAGKVIASGFLRIDPDVLALVVRLHIRGAAWVVITIQMVLFCVVVQAKLTIIVVCGLLIFHGYMLQFPTAIVKVYAGSRCRESVHEHKPYGKHFNHS